MPHELLYGVNYFDQASFTNPGRAIDGDFALYADLSGPSSGGFVVGDVTGTPEWDTPVHQASYTQLDLKCKLSVLGLVNITWELLYAIDGDYPDLEWVAASGDDVDEVIYTKNIADPTTQTINDITAGLILEIVGEPGLTYVRLYEFWLDGTYPAPPGSRSHKQSFG